MKTKLLIMLNRFNRRPRDLKQRFSNLDNSYVAEYSNRVQNEMAQAESEFARAMEMGDTQAAVAAKQER